VARGGDAALAVEDDMPTNLKKLVRTRMTKTGESYATALRYVRRRAGKRAMPAPAADRPIWAIKFRGTARRRDPAVDAYAARQKSPLGETMARLIALVRTAVPSHDELVVHGAPWFCIDGEPFCYVVGYTKHVNLGFCEGTGLADPDGLLEGTGKSMRHVKLLPSRPIAPQKLARLIRQSATRVRSRQAPDRKAKEASHARG
jgi:hypothetical protein